MSDCTAGLLVFRECFAAFRDLILHCLRQRAASRCHRYFPLSVSYTLTLSFPNHKARELELEGRRENKTKHITN